MNLDRYEFEVGNDFTTFEFVSEGKNGRIIKEVRFQKEIPPYIYNLAMGDKNPTTGNINDLVVTDNGDTVKVLATVAAIVVDFTESHPKAIISATGSSKARLRLYRMYISKYLHIIQENFNVLGSNGDKWESFKKENNYLWYAIQRKNK